MALSIRQRLGAAIGQFSATGEKITLAEGPLESMAEVARASQECGIVELSIEVSDRDGL